MAKYAGKGTILRIVQHNPETALTSGTLVSGERYRINTFNSDDDFTNIGAASNASGVEFTATGTTPTHWAHASSLTAIGFPIDQNGDIEFDLGERSSLLDVTTHDNATGVRDKQDNSFKEPGKVSCSFLLDPSNAIHADLIACEATYATRWLIITLPDAGAAKWTGPTRVGSLTIGAPVDNKLESRVTLELLGAMTFTV